MKTKQDGKKAKLKLNKETLKNLTPQELGKVQGGATVYYPYTSRCNVFTWNCW